jgi:phage-related protein
VIRSGLVIISHGFIKKKQKTPPQEIDRAWRILGEDESQQAASQSKPKLQIVKKAGKS